MVRKLVVCCALAGVLGFAVGCEFSSTPDRGTVAARDDAAKDYKAKLDELDRKLDDLKSRAGQAAGDEKGKLETKVKDATAKREVFVKKLEEMKSSTAEKWTGLEDDVKAAYEDFRKAVE